jgi:hypothetical protein
MYHSEEARMSCILERIRGTRAIAELVSALLHFNIDLVTMSRRIFPKWFSVNLLRASE